jgi:phenylalanyl-tRNA synthetase beta chain
MIVNTGWLLDYLAPRIPLADLLPALPRVGLDVEATQLLDRDLRPVRIGFVRAKEPLEGTADKFVCQIEVAKSDVRQIMCASAHPIEVGWGVPVALAGTELPTGVTIQEDQFRGVISQGMICLDGELGMTARGSGLQVFQDEALLGVSLVDAAPVGEALIHVKVYPNRPDCLGLVGIARELAALLGLDVVLPEIPAWQEIPDTMAVEILDPSLCTRYTCRVVKGVKVHKSGPWMASRLMATGSRPINNVVDITNFVLKEWGHPLHAFDLAKVRQKVVVRRLEPHEKLVLLDGKSVTVTGANAPLTIADGVAPMALAGAMGGAESGISDETVDVLLESAHFEPTAIRANSRRLQLSTDASYRFERGMDPNETLEAARERATALLFRDAGAQAAGPVTDVYPMPVKRLVFPLPAERVSGYLGIQVDRAQVFAALTKLGYECSADLLHITVPTRRVDVTDPVVMIEDVARVIGYDAILPNPSSEVPTAGTTTDLDRVRRAIRATLAGQGLLELRGVPLEPLTGEAQFSQIEGESVTIANPLNADLARLRRSLVPFLLKTAALNATRRATTFRYFEMDKIFARIGNDPVEHWALGVLQGGALNDLDWSTRRDADYFDLKGALESVFEALHLGSVTFVPSELEGYVAGSVAEIWAGAGGVKLGVMGQILPAILSEQRINVPVFAAEVFLGPLVAALGITPQFTAIPRFPGVFRDLSFVVKKDVAYTRIEAAIREAGGAYLETVECIDVFAGKSLAKDSRSIAVSMAFRAADRTLASEEVAAQVDGIVAKLKADFAAELRGA